MTIAKLTGTATTQGTISLTWVASGSAIETVVLWRTVGATYWTGVGQPKTATSYTISGLAPGTSYNVRVLQDYSDQNLTLTVPTPAPTPPAPPVPTPTSGPTGVSGNWNRRFFDDFTGTSLNTTTWNPCEGWSNQNGVNTTAKNISVANSIATLQLSGASSGAKMFTNAIGLDVGEIFEFVAKFNSVANWNAGWTGQDTNWPAPGEHDVAENLGNGLTINYHSPSGAHNGPNPEPGNWFGAYHTFSVERQAKQAIVRWDGNVMRTYPTDDNGQPESLVFNTGSFGGNVVTGVAGSLQVDSAAIWAPAS